MSILLSPVPPLIIVHTIGPFRKEKKKRNSIDIKVQHKKGILTKR